MKAQLKKTDTVQGSKRKKLVPLLVGIILLCVLMLLPLFPALTITKTGALHLALCLYKGERFSIRYIHSVNRSPVIDTLEWAGGSTLIVRESLFQTYGAGIPIDADLAGTKTNITQDGIVQSGINTHHSSISLITGTTSDHQLLYRDKAIRLKTLVGEQTSIKLSISRVSLLSLIHFKAPSYSLVQEEA
ncbi:MAG TPA: DUF1850 domain-containing protein [Clostridia bacterium]|nr:DUF1850 domain-containing protein [Clostridia bacterium]